MYDRFVRDFAAKLNPLKLVEMGVKVSRQIDSEFFARENYILILKVCVQILRIILVSSPISSQESIKPNHKRPMCYYSRQSPGQSSSLEI